MRVDLVVFKILFYGKTNIFCCFPINCDVVVLFQHANQVFCILFIGVFYRKVLDHQGKACWSGFVFPETMYYFSLQVSMFGEMFFKEFLGDYPSLR
jgi:hypothetical protein